MLSYYTFLETSIQELLDGLIFVEKGHSVHAQRMIKKSRVYTLTEILSKLFVKIRMKIGELIYVHGLTNSRLGAKLNFIKIYYVITACTTYTITFGIC